MKRKKKIWFWIVLILLAVSAVLFLSVKKKPLIPVETDIVLKRTIIKTVFASGIVEPVKRVNISSSISANIDSLFVSEGQIVKKGDLLVQLDRKNILAEVEQQKAALSQQKHNSNIALLRLRQLELDYDNNTILKNNNFISEIDYENVKLNFEISKTNYESSLENIKLQTAYLDQAKDRLSKTNIYSPLDGIVTRLFREQGEMVLGSQFNNDIVLSVSDLNSFRVNARVDENDIVQISRNDSVKITIDALGEKSFMGIVLEIGNTPLIIGGADSSVEYTVLVDMLTKDERIKPGMTAYAEIITAVVKDALSLPIQALARRKNPDKDNAYDDIIFRLKDNDTLKENGFIVEPVKVTTGVFGERFVEIQTGLEENDRIVSGDYKTIRSVLKEGMIVTATN